MILGSDVSPMIVFTMEEIREALRHDCSSVGEAKTCFFVKLEAFEGEFRVGIAELSGTDIDFELETSTTCSLHWWQPLEGGLLQIYNLGPKYIIRHDMS